VITDLGTQFGVEVDASGGTDLRVFEGLVELAAVASGGAAAPARLAAGSAAEVDEFFEKSKEILKIHDKIMSIEPPATPTIQP
jgi:hypothetical protein